jgi:type VI secretion system protein VasG
MLGISREFERASSPTSPDDFTAIVATSPEGAREAAMATIAGAGAPGGASGAIAPAAMGKQEALKRFTVDLTEQARNNKIDGGRARRRIRGSSTS